MSRFFSFVAAAVLAAVLAAPAHAQQSQTIAPPGNSGVDEYLEVVPGAGGDRPAGGGGAGGGGGAAQTPAKVLGSKTAAQLKALGKDGQAAAQLAAAGAPTTGGGAASSGSAKGSTTGSKSRGGKRLGSDVKPGQSIAAADDGGRVHAIARAIAGDGGGMGLLFPLLLAGALIAAIALFSARRLARR